MIRVGDRFYEADTLWIVEGINDDVVSAKSENEYVQMPDKYVMELMYQQQKQRADELSESNKWLLCSVDNLHEAIEGLLEEKQRADRAENNINELKQDLKDWIDYAEYLADQHSVYDYQRVLDRLNDL